jgi:hypothetical protein
VCKISLFLNNSFCDIQLTHIFKRFMINIPKLFH